MNNPLPPQSRLHELLDYDPKKGILTWRILGKKGGQEGNQAGRINGRGWRRLTVDGVKYKASRVIWMYMTGEDPGEYVVDHENLNRSDDRWENLRKITQGENSKNQPELRVNNKTGYKGISIRSKRNGCIAYRVRVRRIHIGVYSTLENAIRAREQYRG